MAVLITVIVLLIVFFNKNKDKEVKEEKIDYEKVINTYGDYITEIVQEYMSINDDIPTWQYVIEEVDYDKYEVVCDTHIIYSDASVYLSECKVNDKDTKYTYGVELEEIKEGKKVSIYKQEYDGFTTYTSEQYNYSTLVATITCKTDNCEFIDAYDKYVLIKEDSEYYLYDYTNDSLNFGPFSLSQEYNILVSNNTLYGIFYTDDGKNNIYNVSTGKILKDIKGTLLLGEMGFDPTIMYKYNYVILVNNGKNNFVNLKTGNVSYSINENISSFIEDSNNKIVYITAYTNDNSKFKIYNSNGKSLFDGKEYTNFVLGSNILLVSTDTNFKVYDKNLKLKINSKVYDKVLGIYEDYIIVIDGNSLLILNSEDEELVRFEDSWYEEDNIFYSNLSGISNNEIYITIENKKIPYGTKGRFVKYYYIPTTGESNFKEFGNI